MWFARKKYHPTYGIPGTGLRGATIPEQVANLGRGWEWWPTLVWQFTWAWIVSDCEPRSKSLLTVRPSGRWRRFYSGELGGSVTQWDGVPKPSPVASPGESFPVGYDPAVNIVIFSLHSTPMFLVASYVPAFEKVNMYFTQSQW